MLMQTNLHSSTRIQALDGLRGAAALCVAVMHYQDLFATRHFLDFAYIAVDLFFVLSGVVIAMSYEKRIIMGMSFSQFSVNRLARLYPLFILTMLVGLIHAYALVLAGKSEPRLWLRVSDFLSVVPNMLMQPSLNATGTQALFSFNGPAWSVFAEIWINLAFFIWVFAGQRYLAAIVAIAIGSLVWLVLQRGDIDAGWGGGTNSLWLSTCTIWIFYWCWALSLPRTISQSFKTNSCRNSHFRYLALSDFAWRAVLSRSVCGHHTNTSLCRLRNE